MGEYPIYVIDSKWACKVGSLYLFALPRQKYFICQIFYKYFTNISNILQIFHKYFTCHGNSENFAFSPPMILLLNCLKHQFGQNWKFLSSSDKCIGVPGLRKEPKHVNTKKANKFSKMKTNLRKRSTEKRTKTSQKNEN